MHTKITPDWIAADWGTTHLRLWAMQGETPIDHLHAKQGMNTLAPDQFEAALLSLVETWLGDVAVAVPVIVCGMAGARQGWVETPYAHVPCKPDHSTLTQAPCHDPRLDVRIVPGLEQASPADVMRGEETQIAGFMALHSNWDGILCLPGTHTKWVHVSAGEVVSFQTFMTGELFDLLAGASVLRHSVAGEAWDKDAFEQALSDSMSRPERLAAYLFNLRARDLLCDQSKASGRARLSGLLIGAELAAARPFWLGQQVAIIGESALSRFYADALAAQGVPSKIVEAGKMTLAGLHAVYCNIKDSA